ncbi:2-dehydropantoate 2-reductase [Melghirimyces profundicolus]|uniref:2-dehydropantoate 2-reductase n=1 Tax=Melghirimyces profundicolus TaxID=1242148 RepID=A0A2T6B587_9BACL|nr:2-dehydropantoate 2-reductase [Melghirimyces profundicolus]PTX51251.1 2-dehydropantoate 2-reductase [Melghirimyces profundicolus]
MKIAVWGAGAVGLLWAHRLAGFFPGTLLLTRTREQRDKIRAEGLALTGLDGVHRIARNLDVRWSREERLPACDVIFLTVKQTVVPVIAAEVRRVGHSSSDIWLWQNGMGQERLLGDDIDSHRLYRAVTTEGALREGPACVRHTGRGETRVGPVGGESISPLTAGLIRVLVSSGFSIFPDREIDRRAWEKLAINCVINPLTALWNVSNGDLPGREGFSAWMDGILKEVVRVAEAEGIVLSEAELSEKVRAVCRDTAANRSSMLQDLLRGEKTEVDYINGAVGEKGKQHGIPTPFNDRLTLLVHRAEEEGVPEGEDGLSHPPSSG